MWKTASSVWRLARAAAASGAVSSPVPAAGSPSGRANVTTVLFADVLDLQTTETFMKILRKNDTKRHLGVNNATDITQLVDMGLGKALKVRIGVLQDEWLAEDKNDVLWAGVFPMWKKRVVITQIAGQAWDELCHTFYFAAAARKIGMFMTRDGTNDDLIRIDGVEKYTFTDADAGDLSANEASDDDDEDEE